MAIGAAVAPSFDGLRLAASVLAFFFAVGLSAHALDERVGRPLGTAIPDPILVGIAMAGLVGAITLGAVGAVVVSPWLVPFIVAGTFLVLAYNLEAFGGRFHTDWWFAAAWGAFPALTGSFAQAGTLRWPALPVAGACMMLSVAQRALSTPVRSLRRQVRLVEGRVVLRDGREVPLDDRALRAVPEHALRALSAATVLLAVALVLARVL